MIARPKGLISARHRPSVPQRVIARCRAWTTWGALLAVVALAVLLGAAGCGSGTPSQPTLSQLSSGTISESTLEQEYGLRVTRIGVTAAGGMIDFRLQVLDAGKARPLLTDPARLPSLVVPDGGATLTNPGSTDPDMQIEDGRVFFVLFPNTGSAVQPGTSVIVAFGDLRLEPMTAQ